MPVKIPDALPAARVLAEENIFVMTEKRAVTQDIRPLRIAIVNLMPTKEVTETQLLRLIGNSPLSGGGGAADHCYLCWNAHLSRPSQGFLPYL